MRNRITKRVVDALQPGASVADSEVRGFRARCLPSGIVVYDLRGSRAGKRFTIALGQHGRITPDQARDLAKQRAGQVAGGQDLVAERTTAKTAAADTVDALLDQFLERYVRKQGLRSAGEIERALKVYVRPRIGSVPVLELGRRAIVEMLDAVEDNHGPVQADRVLAYVRKALNWHATRDDHFRSPIVRGMSRTRPLERARTRVLDDQETFRDVKP